MSKLRVYLVEDEPLIAAGIERKVVQLGYEVAGSASSGEGALKAINLDPPDLVLMDIKLEGPMDGVETAAEIRTRHEIPVIFLTAYADEATLGRATEQDPFAYIVKPFTDRELYGAIEVAMHRHRLHQELAGREERYRMLSEVLSDFAFSMILRDDGADDEVEWSVGDLQELMGVSIEPPHSVDAFLSVVHPEDAAPVKASWKALRKGEGTQIEFRVIRDEDSIEWIKMDVRVHETDSGGVRIYGALQNVTELRTAKTRLEEREFEFSRIVQTMRQGIWVGDAEDVCIYANRALCEMTGYSREEVVGRNSLALFGRSESALSRNSEEPYEMQFVRSDGAQITLLIAPRVITDPDGVFRGSFNLILDVTRQRRSLETIRRNQRKLVGVFHAGPAASLIIDVATNAVLDVNQAFIDLTGFDRDAIVGFGGFGLADYEDLEDLNRMVSLLKTRVSGTDTIRLRTTSGGSLLLNVEVREIVVDDDELLLLILTQA